MNDRSKWAVVTLYAAGMAWVESAVVYYLRTMIDRIEPYQEFPLPVIGNFGSAEFIREAATLLMLATVGVLAGNTFRKRAGYAVLAFGVWDILYYVFLRVLCGWPHSLADWDILFLIPLPWWGPVWAPVSIALLMVIWGTAVTQSGEPAEPLRFVWQTWALHACGIALALYVFMADAIRVSDQGLDALRRLLPETFNWPVFLLAWLLMGAPVFRLLGAKLVAARIPTSHNGRRPQFRSSLVDMP